MRPFIILPTTKVNSVLSLPILSTVPMCQLNTLFKMLLSKIPLPCPLRFHLSCTISSPCPALSGTTSASCLHWSPYLVLQFFIKHFGPQHKAHAPTIYCGFLVPQIYFSLLLPLSQHPSSHEKPGASSCTVTKSPNPGEVISLTTLDISKGLFPKYRKINKLHSLQSAYYSQLHAVCKDLPRSSSRTSRPVCWSLCL